MSTGELDGEQIFPRVNRPTNYVRISLTIWRNRQEQVPNRSGLNWGQREGRNHDQAYLPIPRINQTNGFFPEIGCPFKVLCDDGAQLTLVRAQQNGKALEVPSDNSALGAYFRRRIGLKSGEMVVLRHLERYGRSSVDIFKDPEGSYFLDFSV